MKQLVAGVTAGIGVTVAVAVILVAVSARGQGTTLAPGQSLRLDFDGLGPGAPESELLGYGAMVQLICSPLTTNDQFRFDLFAPENANPFYSQVVQGLDGQIINGADYLAYGWDPWWHTQGSIELTGLSGSCDVLAVLIRIDQWPWAYGRGFTGQEFAAQGATVPEPTNCMLIGLGMTLFAVAKWLAKGQLRLPQEAQV